MSILRRQHAPDPGMLALLERCGENIQSVSRLLRDLLTDYPEHAGLIDDVQRCEHDGDRIARDIIHRLSANGTTRLPFSASDGHSLATALDDIVDYAEQTADALGVYGVEAPMEQAVALAEVLVGASDRVAQALAALGAGTELEPTLSEIHRLESEGDRLLRDGLASLFADGIDPMVVIRWKDIFASLESSVDACQSVAHVIEGIELKRGRR
ncbi:MAG: uncharacterized protein QOJ35_544 [Solirubrobacteraceae bacterium]|jgi:uncharacterized protein Yka (UPF0111/DUF47 family)|nr:uncharacterized protein [Solirubrobacteraceae bacterium]